MIEFVFVEVLLLKESRCTSRVDLDCCCVSPDASTQELSKIPI